MSCISRATMMIKVEDRIMKYEKYGEALTSSTAPSNDKTFSGAFWISSMSSGVLTMTIHLSINGILNVFALY